MEKRERVINLTRNETGHLYQLNYPNDMPGNIDFTQHLVAPFGHNILLEFNGVEFAENDGCPDNNILEVGGNKYSVPLCATNHLSKCTVLKTIVCYAVFVLKPQQKYAK